MIDADLDPDDPSLEEQQIDNDDIDELEDPPRQQMMDLDGDAEDDDLEGDQVDDFENMVLPADLIAAA